MHYTTVLYQPVFAGFSSCFVHVSLCWEEIQPLDFYFIYSRGSNFYPAYFNHQPKTRTHSRCPDTNTVEAELDLDLPTAPGLPCRPACCSQQSQGAATRGADNSATGAGVVYFQSPFQDNSFHFIYIPFQSQTLMGESVCFVLNTG